MTCRAPRERQPDTDQPIRQPRVRLLDVSPMVWRRLQVPATELHGSLQVAMGWDGLHLYNVELRAHRHGSPELCTGIPTIPLTGLRLRVGSKLRYTCDMGGFWRHEVRVEDQCAVVSGRDYPLCLAGDQGCPVEDSGGPPGWRERRRELTGFAALGDMAEIGDLLATVAAERTLAGVDRMREREHWLPQEFCRIQVNDRFRRGEHKALMHQQVWWPAAEAAMQVRMRMQVVDEDGMMLADDAVFDLARGEARPGTLGLSLDEAKQMLRASRERVLAVQAAAHAAGQRNCPDCGRVRSSKGVLPVRFRTLFGTVQVPGRRLRHCACHRDGGAQLQPADNPIYSTHGTRIVVPGGEMGLGGLLWHHRRPGVRTCYRLPRLRTRQPPAMTSSG